MRLLLDSHAFAWWLLNDAALSERAIRHIADPANEVFVSAVTAFEMAIKYRIGKWPEVGELLMTFEAELVVRHFQSLPISIAHGVTAGKLSAEHKDPFDRLLAAQAIVEDMAVVTHDIQITGLGARVIW